MLAAGALCYSGVGALIAVRQPANRIGWLLLLVGLYWAAAPALGFIYLAGVVLVTVLLIWEHWLVRPDDLSRVNQAFFQVNAVVSLGLFALVLVQLAIGS